jgi:hypothetical protein
MREKESRDVEGTTKRRKERGQGHSQPEEKVRKFSAGPTYSLHESKKSYGE